MATAKTRRDPRDDRVTPGLVQSILKAEPGVLVERLAKALQAAWQELSETQEELGRITLELAEAQALPPKEVPEKAEKAFDGREKVLVMIDPLGLVECYAESWVDVRVVSVRPWETDEEVEWRISSVYRELMVPVKLRANGMPAVKPVLNDEALMTMLNWEARCAANQKLDELIQAVRERKP